MEVAFRLDIFVDISTERVFLLAGQVFYANVRVDARRFQNFIRRGTSDTEDIGQADFDTFFLGQIDTCNSCHFFDSLMVL